jgi:hypothetical protein
LKVKRSTSLTSAYGGCPRPMRLPLAHAPKAEVGRRREGWRERGRTRWESRGREQASTLKRQRRRHGVGAA